MDKFIAAPKEVMVATGVEVEKKGSKFYFKETGDEVDLKKYVIFVEDDYDYKYYHEPKEREPKQPGEE